MDDRFQWKDILQYLRSFFFIGARCLARRRSRSIRHKTLECRFISKGTRFGFLLHSPEFYLYVAHPVALWKRVAIEVSTSPWHRLHVSRAFPTPPWSARVFFELRGRIPQHSLADRILSCQARRPDDNKAAAFFASPSSIQLPKMRQKMDHGRQERRLRHILFLLAFSIWFPHLPIS